MSNRVSVGVGASVWTLDLDASFARFAVDGELRRTCQPISHQCHRRAKTATMLRRPSTSAGSFDVAPM